MASSLTILFSILGGILPALFWLWFWLQEDRLHPEPRALITIVFVCGMISVFFVLPIEKFIFSYFLGGLSLITIILWAGVEEIFKYLASYFSALHGKEMNEPIDAVIYMITAALGFSALENTLFLFNLIDLGKISETLITGNSRFLGATLLHTASSAAIGVMIGLSYYKKRWIKIIYILLGLVISIGLHTIFNLLIMKLEKELFFVFSGVWVLIISLILLIEKIKKVNPGSTNSI